MVSNGAVEVTFAKNADHDIATYMLVYPQVPFGGIRDVMLPVILS